MVDKKDFESRNKDAAKELKELEQARKLTYEKEMKLKEKMRFEADKKAYLE